MSHSQSENSVGDQVPHILESQFSTELRIVETDDEISPTSEPSPSVSQQDGVDGLLVAQHVVLSTHSPAAMKLGTQQLFPKNLAAASRPKNRHHTTVVMFPVGLENSSKETRTRHSSQGPDVSWDDYDSDGDGFALRRNRRNKSYRAAVTSLDIEAMVRSQGDADTLKPVREDQASSPSPARSPRRKV